MFFLGYSPSKKLHFSKYLHHAMLGFFLLNSDYKILHDRQIQDYLKLHKGATGTM